MTIFWGPPRGPGDEMSDAPERFGYAGAKDLTGLPIGTLRYHVSRDQIPHLRLGPRTVVFERQALEKWLAEQDAKERARKAKKRTKKPASPTSSTPSTRDKRDTGDEVPSK